jgi:RNA polymerase sigma-70 factor (sigma-E family)
LRHEDEFTEFVAARRLHMRRFAYLLCRDWHQAEDLVQTAFAKLYVAWSRIRRAESEESYVRRTIVRAYLDERRRPWRRETVLDRLPDRTEPEGLSYEESDELRRAVRDLPARQRAALVLRHWWGLSVEEAAADLGVTAGTVKSNTARAVERLRNVLGNKAREEIPRS